MDIDFKNLELKLENGFIRISDKMETNLSNVFAIGDITGKLMLAHSASKQGLIVADIMNNEINADKKRLLI